MNDRRRVCYFCKNKAIEIDYKDISSLKRYLTFNGRIQNRSRTGTCAKHQKRLTKAIKKARQLALMHYVKG